MLEEGKRVSLSQYLDAKNLLTEISAAVDTALKDFDAVLEPAAPTARPRKDWHLPAARSFVHSGVSAAYRPFPYLFFQGRLGCLLDFSLSVQEVLIRDS